MRFLFLAFLAACTSADTGRPAPRVDSPVRYFVPKAYAAAVRERVRSNLHIPPEVPETATVTFLVRLSGNGRVSTIERRATSGSRAYDEAVERAILRSQPFPLLELKGKQPPLELVFRVKELGPGSANTQ